ncbi:PPR repeat [Musa troglodytarum]|uniref:PPR repeat n=1 Tax=Musa troglodytarum TaxID=320322 RepID=A0A9E7JBD1_9LILI|nr:PPR repeat [Musa troglodytarum]
MINFGGSLRTTGRFRVSYFSNLIDRCVTLGSLSSAQSIHAHLVKTGLHRHTFLGNRLLGLYSGLGSITLAIGVFHDIPDKNRFTWNILLMALVRTGRVEAAHELFEEMPERDVVSCNSLISGYVSTGYVDKAFGVLHRMQDLGVKVTAFTLSITASCVSSPRQAKQVHGLITRFGLGSLNTVLGNSLIDMYGRVGLAGYASQIFCAMDNSDVISWNSMISAYGRSGCGMEALECFCAMRAAGFSTDEFTMSSVLNICTDLENLAKGEQLLAHCFKMGFLSNSIVSSAVIDMYSMFGRLDDAVRIFQGMPRWDSVLCDSMYSGYVRSSTGDEAIKLFVVALRKSVMPTEFTFATILNSRTCFCSTVLGMQIHCWVCKTGFEADMIVANSLVDMYAKLGFVESAMKIFSNMVAKDLVSWNTMIMGLAKNGQGVEALRIFRELQGNGVKPDRITLAGVLLACSYGHMVHEGKRIFSLMEKKYGVMRNLEHYACMVDMMGRAGMLKETLNIIETSPHSHSLSLWNLLLNACRINGDLEFATIIAEKLLDFKAPSSLPYLLLAQMYGVSGRWESMARVLKAMEERGVRKVQEYSWICVRKHIYVFKTDQLFHWEGKAVYSMLQLLDWVMNGEGCVHEESTLYGDCCGE